MPALLCQIEAILKFIDSYNDPNLRACCEGLRQAIGALRRHIASEAAQ